MRGSAIILSALLLTAACKPATDAVTATERRPSATPAAADGLDS